MANKLHLWLRAECKPGERRALITPKFAKKLVDEGFKLDVESSPQRIFADEDYVASGCELKPCGSWKTEAPDNAIILGIKELDDGSDDRPLKNEHVYFAHCFKNQKGWDKILGRFKSGGGTLYDLEYLVDARGVRVAAFGHHAGVCGAAIGLDLWAKKNGPPNDSPYKIPSNIKNYDDLVQRVSSRMTEAVEKHGATLPVIAVVGYMGRCGAGAVEFLESVKYPKEKLKFLEKQSTADTPDAAVKSLDYDILINCVYISSSTTPFITKELIISKKDNMKLNIIVDVSCDPSNPANPIPIYDTCTTLDSPVLTVNIGGKDIDIVAIDHLPSILPLDSSERFCSQLYKHLLNLPDRSSDEIWSGAKKTFLSHLKKLD